MIGNLIPYHLPSSFSASEFFLLVNFCGQTSAREVYQGHSTSTAVYTSQKIVTAGKFTRVLDIGQAHGPVDPAADGYVLVGT